MIFNNSKTDIKIQSSDYNQLNSNKNSIKTQQMLVDSWMIQFGNDYISHAVWNGNFSSIMQMKEVLPAEAILRQGKTVEYEKGSTYGSRGQASLKEIPLELIDQIDQYSLTEENNNELADLESFFKTKSFSDGQEYFEICSQDELDLLKKYKDLDNSNKLWREAREYIEQHDKILEEKDEIFLKDCSLKQAQGTSLKIGEKLKKRGILYLVKFRLDAIKFKSSRLKYLQRLKLGINFNRPHENKNSYYSSFDSPCFEQSFVNNKKNELMNLFESKKFLLSIAYDQTKNNAVDNYLTSKYNQWIKKKPEQRKAIVKRLWHARDLQFRADKLNSEIRAARNSIYWNYGDIVILRGNAKEIIMGDADFDSSVTSGEAFLLSPWMNQGKFFTLPLVQKETVILGKKEKLEPYAKDLDQMGAAYVYVEDLTDKQKDFFKCK